MPEDQLGNAWRDNGIRGSDLSPRGAGDIAPVVSKWGFIATRCLWATFLLLFPAE